MKNEDRYMEFDAHMANLDMQHQKRMSIESAIAARKIESTRSKRLEDQRKREEFVHRVMNILTFVAIAIVAYSLFHFS